MAKLLRVMLVLALLLVFVGSSHAQIELVGDINEIQLDQLSPDLYTPIDKVPLNVKEQMTLSPMFTPDNALRIHVAWTNQANTSIKIQNQYIKHIDSSLTWETDANPLVTALVAAAGRGVNVQVQVREEADDDDVATYLNGITNIEVRYMGSSTSASGGWLSNTHNKLMIVDSKVSLVSSINFGDAFTENREAGMVIQSATVSAYYGKFFDADWLDGEIPPVTNSITKAFAPSNSGGINTHYESHTNIPPQNFSGTYNVSAFVNPDNANDIIFDYLNSAKESIYVSMYTISRQDFVDVLVDLKKNNPAMDIQVLISERRVGASENVDTKAAAEELVANLIPVYNSTDGLRFYHNKYWIIDGKHTFVYSGNWSPHSVTVPETDDEYASGDPNRDMGIAVHDASDIANFFKTQVWDLDVAAGSAWELPIGISQTSFDQAEVVSGIVDLTASISGIEATAADYRFGGGVFMTASVSDSSFSVTFDTNSLANGVHTFEVMVDSGTQTFADSVEVTVANYANSENWRVLITEALPNPDGIDDSAGEFFELTNSFPFEVLLEGWIVGDDNGEHVFGSGYTIPAYTSLIFARDKAGFDGFFSVAADFEVGISMVNSGDAVFLLNQAADPVDAVAWGDGLALDGSERNNPPAAGKSLSRDPLHIDTNTKSDFSETDPSPKAQVPHQQLLLPGETADDPVPWMLGIETLLLVLLLPIWRKARWND